VPFIGNAGRQGAHRNSASSSADDWAGTIAAGATKILGPLQSVGLARAAWNVNIGGANLPASVVVEYRVGPAWRVLAVVLPALGQPTNDDAVAAGREVRMRIVAPAALAVTVTAASLFATASS